MNDLPDGLRINLGSGPHNPSGWLNIDGSWQVRFAGRPWLARLASVLTRRDIGNWPAGIVHRDLRRGLGFDADSASVVYSSHTLEHLYRDEALSLLRDARRVLKPGGVCRIIVPDVGSIVRWYLDHRHEPADAKKQASSDLLMGMLHVRPNQAPRRRGLLAWYRGLTEFDTHKWMYDSDGLAALIEEAGFDSPKRCDYLDSAIPRSALTLVEQRSRICDGAGICVEARK